MTRLAGIAAAPGVASGPAWRHVSRLPKGTPWPSPALSPAELGAFAERAARDLEALAARVRAGGRDEEAGIFEAQALMVTDPVLLDECVRRIGEGSPPAAAIRDAADAAARTIEGLDDDLLAGRAADVRDVGARLARLVEGDELELPMVPSIAVADDLPPSVTAEIGPGLLLGIALEEGSQTAHAAILARSLGIPAVMGVAGLLAEVAERSGTTTVAVDGSAGEVTVEPTADDLRRLEVRRGEAPARPARPAPAASNHGRPAILADGERVTLLANWSSARDTERALAARAEGIGLFRTEFLFMGRSAAPTESEQAAVYRAAFEAFGPHGPVVIRLADIGGDKQLPYLHLAPESNPFLGVRGLRLAARNRGLLVTQIRAISIAAADADVVPHVMAPMVATVEDVDLFQGLVGEAQASLAREGRAHALRFVTGIMVEIPAASLAAADLAPLVNFFSIGTNDLTQYVMAADRMNPALAARQDALHPAVLRAIELCVRGADAAAIPVAVCGELAGDPAGALVLVGLGVDELSADPGTLDATRAHLAAVTRTELDQLGGSALAARTADEVRALAAPLLARAGESPGDARAHSPLP